MVAKQIYANHYFEGALEVAAVIDRENPGEAPGTYLVLLRRFRFDNLPTGPVVSIRSKVVGRFAIRPATTSSNTRLRPNAHSDRRRVRIDQPPLFATPARTRSRRSARDTGSR